MSKSRPPLTRDEGRPVRRRTRTFRPNYLSFAGTYQCNLSCPHCCVPIEWPDRLDIDVALRFLEDAHREGVEILGFTGGEPFLYPEFLLALTGRAAELGMRFDKVQTNGVWFSDEAHRSEEHTSELQSPCNLVCRLLLEKKKKERLIKRRRQHSPPKTAAHHHE